MARALAPAEPILVAASGGGDSTALLALLAPVAKAQGRALIAGVVDHALRLGSDTDAARAARIAEDLGAIAHVLRLEWPDGPRTAQAAARTARYTALAGLARRVGASTAFLGHTADDQAETIYLRRAEGSGPRGLAGMAALAPCPVWPAGRDLTLARPLLNQRRADLRDQLRALGVPWLEDPANALVRYARVRARAALNSGGVAPLLAEAEVHAAHAVAADRSARHWLADAVLGDDEAKLPPATDPAHLRALAAVLAAYGGATREPSPAAVAHLAGRGQGALAGALVRPGWRISRDPGGVHGRRGGGEGVGVLSLPVAEAIVWDNRLALTARRGGVQARAPPRGARLAPVIAGKTADALWLPAARVWRLLYRGA